MFFFKQETAYEMRISDWSSDVCSSDLWLYGGVLKRIPHIGLVDRVPQDLSHIPPNQRTHGFLTAVDTVSRFLVLPKFNSTFVFIDQQLWGMLRPIYR